MQFICCAYLQFFPVIRKFCCSLNSQLTLVIIFNLSFYFSIDKLPSTWWNLFLNSVWFSVVYLATAWCVDLYGLLVYWSPICSPSLVWFAAPFPLFPLGFFRWSSSNTVPVCCCLLIAYLEAYCHHSCETSFQKCLRSCPFIIILPSLVDRNLLNAFSSNCGSVLYC